MVWMSYEGTTLNNAYIRGLNIGIRHNPLMDLWYRHSIQNPCVFRFSLWWGCECSYRFYFVKIWQNQQRSAWSLKKNRGFKMWPLSTLQAFGKLKISIGARIGGTERGGNKICFVSFCLKEPGRSHLRYRSVNQEGGAAGAAPLRHRNPASEA